MAEDDELLAAWSGGDADAGNLLLERHFSSVFRFFRSKLDVMVDELVQRTFEACLENRDQYRGTSSFKAWLMGIARYQLLRYLQRERSRCPESLDPERMSILQVTATQSPSAIVAERQEQRILLRALVELPIELQITLELHYWEELTVAEMADALGIPAGTVKSRLRRARHLLEEAIARVADTPALAEQTTRDLDQWARSLRAKLAKPERAR